MHLLVVCENVRSVGYRAGGGADIPLGILLRGVAAAAASALLAELLKAGAADLGVSVGCAGLGRGT